MMSRNDKAMSLSSISSHNKPEKAKRSVSFPERFTLTHQTNDCGANRNATFSPIMKQPKRSSFCLSDNALNNTSERSTCSPDTVSTSFSDDVSSLQIISTVYHHSTQSSSLLLEEKHTPLRIRIVNDSSKRRKDLVVDRKENLNLYDAVYNHPAVKAAHVRKWGPAQVKQVKENTSEIQIVLWCDIRQISRHVFTVPDLKQTSTQQLAEMLPHEEEEEYDGPIVLLLQCVPKRSNQGSSSRKIQHHSLPPTSIEVETRTPTVTQQVVAPPFVNSPSKKSLSQRLSEVKKSTSVSGASTGDSKIDRFLGLSSPRSTTSSSSELGLSESKPSFASIPSFARSASTLSNTSCNSTKSLSERLRQVKTFALEGSANASFPPQEAIISSTGDSKIDRFLRLSRPSPGIPRSTTQTSEVPVTSPSTPNWETFDSDDEDSSDEDSSTLDDSGKPPLNFLEATTTSTSTAQHNISISAANMAKLFPFHIVINHDFVILQTGKDLPKLVSSPEGDGDDDSLFVGGSIRNVLNIVQPPRCAWDWPTLERLERQEQHFFVRPEGAHSNRKIKASLTTLSTNPKQVMIICSPDCKNVNELEQYNLTMKDLPLHTFQRDVVFLGEHISSEVRSSHMLNKLSRKLENEKKFSNLLLNKMLPGRVATDLRAGKTIDPEVFDDVTIFFSDIVGFTKICTDLEPDQVIFMLNQLYTVMDFVAAKFDLYRVKTIGDAYMACSGVPEPQIDHAHRVSQFALMVREAAKQVLSPVSGEPIQLRIGIHSGSCIGGIVGNLTPFYDLFGDTINIAARHESTGEAGKIHVSEETQAILTFQDRHGEYFADSYKITRRGHTQMKGKGEMVTYWLDLSDNHNITTDDGMTMEEVSQEASIILQGANRKAKFFRRRRNSECSSIYDFDDRSLSNLS